MRGDYFTEGDPVSPKARAFVKELEALCIKHGVCLSTSGYDGLQIWPLDERDPPIHAAGIEDRIGVLKLPDRPCDKCGPLDSICKPHNYCPCYRVPFTRGVAAAFEAADEEKGDAAMKAMLNP